METATEQPKLAMNGTAAVDLNSNDPKAKRKSVSFVDEKLIMDALNSTSSNGASGGKSKPHYNRSNSDKPNGAKSPNNGRTAYSNGSKPRHQNGAANGHSKSIHQKSAPTGATNGAAAKNNAVIVYYNDPTATDINVEQLLTTTKPAADELSKLSGENKPAHNSIHKNKANFVPKSVAQSNGHQQHNKHLVNGANKAINGNTNGNGQQHPSKFADNWRFGALRMDEPQYQAKPFTSIANGANGANGLNGGGKPNGKAHPQQHPKSRPTPNGKINGTFEKKAPAVKSEPITIYYSTPASSEVIEQNLKQLQVKDSTSTNGASEAKGDAAPITATPNDVVAADPVDNGATESSQANVINVSQPIAMEAESVPMPPLPPGPVSGDQYDVISGGVPIEPPILPVEGTKHAVQCMLVSHPGHFYVKFLNSAHQALLDNMNQFYNSDEHIDLSVDVLKAGQYFAAGRTKSADAGKEWLRVQLLHVESPELLNCLLIDEGCFGMFNISDLQPLYNQFRSVPKQAIRASLAGVIPKESDWLPKQALEFKHLVADRQFHTGTEQTFDQKAFEEKQTLEIELYFTDTDGELAGKSVAEVVVERDIASKK